MLCYVMVEIFIVNMNIHIWWRVVLVHSYIHMYTQRIWMACTQRLRKIFILMLIFIFSYTKIILFAKTYFSFRFFFIFMNTLRAGTKYARSDCEHITQHSTYIFVFIWESSEKLERRMDTCYYEMKRYFSSFWDKITNKNHSQFYFIFVGTQKSRSMRCRRNSRGPAIIL